MLRGFVTFEGIDGSGKTTVSRRVAEILRSSGERVFLTGEPTRHWTGEAVRRSYADDVGPLAESFLFLADRAAHQTEIRQHLDGGEVVISDRYADSTYAYQGARLRGIVPRPIPFLRGISEPWLLRPNLTILLRIPAELGLRRIADRPAKVRFEELAFLRRVARNYDALAKSRRFAVQDGRGPAEEVAQTSVATIRRRLARR
ncbi:MAG TPA: dTMP kinase [Thermoplasmata archaeon]|nr:dTMP kinase [Thermoplasmata archaeon]